MDTNKSTFQLLKIDMIVEKVQAIIQNVSAFVSACDFKYFRNSLISY